MQVPHPIADVLVDQVAHRLAVLVQPLRIRMIELELEGEMSVQALADSLDAAADCAAGVEAELARPVAYRNLLSGLVSLTAISPVWSLEVMPENVAACLLGRSGRPRAPSMPAENDEYGPPRNSSRLTACS
jgi:hypothetical protein